MEFIDTWRVTRHKSERPRALRGINAACWGFCFCTPGQRKSINNDTRGLFLWWTPRKENMKRKLLLLISFFECGSQSYRFEEILGIYDGAYIVCFLFICMYTVAKLLVALLKYLKGGPLSYTNGRFFVTF